MSGEVRMVTILGLPESIAVNVGLSNERFEGTPCWRWSGRARKEDGRPMIGRAIYAYRHIYSLLRCDPVGVLHHRCEKSWCVNPWHAEAMSQSDHMREHDAGGDWGQAQKTRCPAGHSYDDVNTYRWRNERQCRICRRETKRRFRAKLKRHS